MRPDFLSTIGEKKFALIIAVCFVCDYFYSSGMCRKEKNRTITELVKSELVTQIAKMFTNIFDMNRS